MDDLSFSPATIKLFEILPLAAPAATISFTPIRSDLRSLRLEFTGRGDAVATSVAVVLRCNGDGGANYDRSSLTVSQTTATATEGLAATSILLGNIAAASVAASSAGTIILEIPFYAGTTFRKAISGRTHTQTADVTGGISLNIVHGRWRSASAITSLLLLPASGNFDIGTSCVLYGVQ